MIATALSTESSLLRAGTASAGSPTVSPVAICSLLPRRPPASLMQASAALAPANECVPTLAYWPVNGCRSPKTIVPPELGAALVAAVLALASGALAAAVVPGVLEAPALHAETTTAVQQINAAAVILLRLGL